MRNKRTGLINLIYFSRSALMGDAAMRLHQLGEISRQAQKKNEFSVITSFLIMEQNYFMQVLEGERSSVQEAWTRILADPRHRDAQIAEWREIPRRRFVTSFTTGVRDAGNDIHFQRANLGAMLQRGTPKAAAIADLALALQTDALAKQGIEHLLV